MDAEQHRPKLPADRNFRRRDFLRALLATGISLAARPSAAQTPAKTGSQGLTAGAVEVPVSGRRIPAYRALPREGKTFPVVVVVHDVFGVNPQLGDVCRRLAKLGYLAVAPDLYARHGDPAKLASPAELTETLVARVPEAQVMNDLDATVAWAGKNGGDTRRLGITGFGWGGRIVWLYAAHTPTLNAGVAWYGPLTGTADDLRPRQPVDIAKGLKAPVLGLYGGKDIGIPPEAVAMMREELKTGRDKSEIILYPDAPHAFFAGDRPSFRRAAAEDGWKRMHEWFKRHGVA